VKDKIRKQVLKTRFALPPAQRSSKSAEIEARLFGQSEFRSAAVIMFFASFQSEVETHHMIRRALAEGKRVVLPRVKGKELELLEIENYERDVAPGAWGIPEPERGRPVELKDIGLIVMPGAVFDVRGNRIGYGGGFYDKLLPLYTGRTVALAFELQIIPEVPAAAHDIPVHMIITEKRIIDARSR
jgi:5-formyltetrahydrofolate cyclo-ligase